MFCLFSQVFVVLFLVLVCHQADCGREEAVKKATSPGLDAVCSVVSQFIRAAFQLLHLLFADSQGEVQVIHTVTFMLWSRHAFQHSGSRPKYLSSFTPSVSKTQQLFRITAFTSGYKLVEVWGLCTILFHSLAGPSTYTQVRIIWIKICNLTCSSMFIHIDRHDQGETVTYSDEKAL